MKCLGPIVQSTATELFQFVWLHVLFVYLLVRLLQAIQAYAQ